MPTNQELLTHSINVSGAFDNCFFHALSAHFIANNRPLPEDLFHFKSLLGNQSNASNLMGRFPNAESLSLFNDASKQGDHDFIFEKTLILGVLFREWFATKMFESRENQAAIQPIFERFKKLFGLKDIPKEDIMGDVEGVLYTANQAFIKSDAIKHTPEALEDYWTKEGLKNYCKLIATPNTKLSYLDVLWVFEQYHWPIIIYQHPTENNLNEAHMIAQHPDPENPSMLKIELTLQTREGHYTLLKTMNTARQLDKYKQSLDSHITARSQFLANESMPDENECLFVKAICTPDQVQSPFNELLKTVDGLAIGASEGLNVEAVNQVYPVLQNPDDSVDESKTEPGAVLKHIQFETYISRITQQIEKFKTKKHTHAQSAAETLLTKLNSAKEGFQNSSISLTDFKATCTEAINASKEVLQQHRGLWSQLLHWAVIIATLGQYRMNQEHGGFFKTKSSKILKELQGRMDTLGSDNQFADNNPSPRA